MSLTSTIQPGACIVLWTTSASSLSLLTFLEDPSFLAWVRPRHPRNHCILCQSELHTTSNCPKTSKLFVPNNLTGHEPSHDFNHDTRRDSKREAGINREPAATYARHRSFRSPSFRSTDQKSGAKDGPCRFWNRSTGCKFDAASCRRRHFCTNCRAPDHGSSSCPTKKPKTFPNSKSH